jgi:ABC-type nitrate/sulfonate/bicarbonate transport system permease component
MTLLDSSPETAAAKPGPQVAKPTSGLVLFLSATVRTVVPVVLGTVVVILLWMLFLKVFNVLPAVGKGPDDVWRYLVNGPAAGAHRTKVFDGLKITLGDAVIGYVAGLVAATVVALSFVLSRGFEQAMMPIAMLLRSVPLVAMTPVIILVFGRGKPAIAVICGIVVFFPALVNITFGIRAAPPQAMDLVAAYGGSQWTALRKVALPMALPAFFASARISVPGSLVGALLAEWLATGRGIGSNLQRAAGGFRYTELWSSVVVVTGASIILYTVVGVLESLVLARFGRNAGRS